MRWFWSVLSCLLMFSLRAEEETPYVIFYVDAPGLCYDHFESLCHSLAQKKERGKPRANVGHAWIHLHGHLDGRKIDLTVGHSGELGITDWPYFDGVMDAVERKSLNPIAYMFSTLHDGYAELSSGGHIPTLAVKRQLTDSQLRAILRFIHPKRYPYGEYALTKWQCSSFVAHVAALADLKLEHQVSVQIPKMLTFRGWRMRLWTDPRYRVLTFSAPDKIEASLRQLAKTGKVVKVEAL